MPHRTMADHHVYSVIDMPYSQNPAVDVVPYSEGAVDTCVEPPEEQSLVDEMVALLGIPTYYPAAA